uniref:AIR12 DOMON domain-containing protein n=1 Tax=Oryza meridionalis TaxID=40149 RepID=A0A0E0CWL0_9ORYZ
MALPMNSTTQNTVWQAGPGSTGAIGPHPTSGQNLRSMQRLDRLTSCPGRAPEPPNSRMP